MIITSTSGDHVLTFDDAKHSYTLDGKKVPGATDVKKGYPPSRSLIVYYIKQGLAEFTSGKKLKAQADVGTYMHDYCYAKRFNKPFDMSAIKGHKDEKKILKRFQEVDKWLETVKSDKVVMAEQIIASPLHQFAGKFDCLIERDGKKILQDYKSAKGFFEDAFIQEGGYAIALEEWLGIKVDGLEVIRFNDNTDEPQAFCIDDPKHVQDFKDQFIRCRYTRQFQNVWQRFFEKKYKQENPWIK